MDAETLDRLGDEAERAGFHALAEDYWMRAIAAWDELFSQEQAA